MSSRVAHLEREHQHRLRRMLGDVRRHSQPEGRFSHRRARADDVEGARLQAGEQFVEVVVAGGRAGDRVASLVVLLELIHRDVEQFLDRPGRVDHAILGDLEHLRLGQVDGLGDVVGLGECQVGDLAGGVDQPAQQRGVHHDAGIVLGTRHRWRRVLQVVEPFDAADLVEQTVAAQFVGDRDHVDGSRRRVQRPDRVEDVLVRRAVEVADVQSGFADDTDRVTAEQQGAEDRFLRLEVVRRNPPAAVGRRVGPIIAVGSELLVDRHGDPTLPGSSCVVEEEQPWVFAVERLWTTA